MEDLSKTNQELLKENTALKQKISELEQAAAEQRQVEEKLRISEKQFRAIADNSPDLEHWMGPDGKFLWISPNALEFTGYTAEECLSMADYPLCLVAESDQEIIGQIIIDALQKPGDGNLECQFTLKDGQKRWASIAWRPIYDNDNNNLGYLGSARDITSRKQMEDQLRDTKERLEAMINALPDLMFRIDRDGMIHEYYTLDTDLLYMAPSSFLNKKITEVIPEEAAQIIMDALDKAAACGRHRGATYSLTMPQGQLWFELSIETMGNRKQPAKQFIALIRDITSRKRLEEELKKAHDELEVRVQERTVELAQVVKTLTENERMLANKSHRLHEANTALKVLLRYREEDQQDMEGKILTNIKKLVLPYLEKLNSTPLTPLQKACVNMMNANLHNILSPFLKNLSSAYMDFTPREIEVANLVRDGKCAKDIALLLDTSIRSIEFHKNNIRRKLGIVHTKKNLRTFLLSLSDTPAP